MPDTKIIATMGPASADMAVLEKMAKNGLSAVRINTAHADPGYIGKIKGMIDRVNKKLGTYIGVLVDLKGPELRTGEFPGGSFEVKAGSQYILAPEGTKGDVFTINYPAILNTLTTNDLILMSDGRFRFKVVKSGKNQATVKSLDSGRMRDRSRINVPGKYLDLGVLTDRDIIFLKEGIKENVEFFALSFVQKKENVEHLQKQIMTNGGDQLIVSKIETKSGLQNIRTISRVSDLVMVARGDLGVELPLEEVVVAQKKIIDESHRYGVPTIVATQMLESMVNSSSPTRAEVSDVTNAIMDNTDCVMLSEETAIGKFPAEAVEYLNRISTYVEDKVGDFREPDDFLGNRVAYSISRAAKVVASEIEADGIVAFTQSGNTAKMISAVRPCVPIYTIVTDPHLGRKLNLFRGIRPVRIEPVKSDDGDLYETILSAEKSIKIRKGARLVITSGAPNFLFGGTNEVMVSTFGKFLGRGYPSGKSFRGIVAGKRVKGDILIVNEDISEERDDFRKYRGIIFTGKASHEVMETLESSGIPVLYNTKIREKISEGDEIFIDGYTGIINS